MKQRIAQFLVLSLFLLIFGVLPARSSLYNPTAGGGGGTISTVSTSTGTNFTAAVSGADIAIKFPSFLDGVISTSSAKTAFGFATDFLYHSPTSTQKVDLGLNDSAYRDDQTGGGGAYQSLEIALNPSGAATATTTPASLFKKIGTNYTTHVLDFDGTTAQQAYWNRKLPVFTALNTCVIYYSSLADTVTTASSTVWGWTYRPVGDNEAYDATTGETLATTSVSYTVVSRLYNSSTTVATSSLASEDTILLELGRVPSDSGDAMTSDARYVAGKLVCDYR